MGRMYLDHHNIVHFDASSDGRFAKAAALPKALLLVIAHAEKLCADPSTRTKLERVKERIMLLG